MTLLEEAYKGGVFSVERWLIRNMNLKPKDITIIVFFVNQQGARSPPKIFIPFQHGHFQPSTTLVGRVHGGGGISNLHPQTI